MARLLHRLAHLSRNSSPNTDVRAAFWRAEQYLGDDYAALVAVDHPRTLDGGAAERLCQSTHRTLALVEG